MAGANFQLRGKGCILPLFSGSGSIGIGYPVFLTHHYLLTPVHPMRLHCPDGAKLRLSVAFWTARFRIADKVPTDELHGNGIFIVVVGNADFF